MSDLVPRSTSDLTDHTPARVLVGRAGPGYRTATWLKLREDHAAARDAVRTEVDFEADFEGPFIEEHRLFSAATQARSKAEYLVRPDLGRRLDRESRERIVERCPRGIDFQVVIGDGLSPTAVIRQVPALLPLLVEESNRRGWRFGRPFAVRYCRVGVLNDVGDILAPKVVVLLIGERPGLATAESLSAYLAYRPRTGHTDADRNLISNIHSRGVAPVEAARRIVGLAEACLAAGRGGVGIAEGPPPLGGRRRDQSLASQGEPLE